MTMPSLLLRSLLVVTTATALLAGCSAPDPSPRATEYAGGGSADDAAEGAASGDAGDGSASGLARATADGLPGLGITECPELDDYEYSSNSGRSFWHLVYTCTSRDAFDATTASLVAEGYDASPLVISEGNNVSERNYFQADANGGSTEVQLNLVGSPDELEFEIFVTVTLP
jgi:hypothetical protein